MRSNERVIAAGKKFHFRHLVPRSMLRFWESVDRKCDRRLAEFRYTDFTWRNDVTEVVLEHHFGNDGSFVRWFLFWRDLFRCLAFLLPWEVLGGEGRGTLGICEWWCAPGTLEPLARSLY